MTSTTTESAFSMSTILNDPHTAASDRPQSPVSTTSQSSKNLRKQKVPRLKHPKKTETDPTPPIVETDTYKKGWTKEEHLKFLQGLELFGRGQWKEIATYVGTKSSTQLQAHANRVSSKC